MSITIENAEIEALLADLAETTRQLGPDLLLDLHRRERRRIHDESERRIAEGLAADEAMRRRLNAILLFKDEGFAQTDVIRAA